MAVSKENSGNGQANSVTDWTFSFGYTPASGVLVVVGHYSGAAGCSLQAAAVTAGWVRVIDCTETGDADQGAIYAIIGDGVINSVALTSSAAKDQVATVSSYLAGTGKQWADKNGNVTGKNDEGDAGTTLDCGATGTATADDGVAVGHGCLAENSVSVLSSPTDGFTLLGEYVRQEYRSCEGMYKIFTTAETFEPDATIDSAPTYGSLGCVAAWIIEDSGGGGGGLPAGSLASLGVGI